MPLSLPLSLHALIDELPLPLPAEAGDLDALVVGMILEGEFGLTLTDRELTPEALADREKVRALLDRHGIT